MPSSRFYSSLPIPVAFLTRVWNTFTSTFTLPSSSRDVLFRINHNFTYFSIPYALQCLLLLFLSLIPTYPILLLIFFPFLIAWFIYLCFRPYPFVLFDLEIDNSLLLVALWIVTAITMLVHGLWFNVFLSFCIGFGIVALHATFRKTDDLYMPLQQPSYGTIQSFASGTPYSS